MRNEPEQITPLANALMLMEQIGLSLPFGIMVSNIDGIVLYKNSIFETWLPEYPVDNKLWFIQMYPYLEQEEDQEQEKQKEPNLKGKSLNWLLKNRIDNDSTMEICWQGQKQFFRIRTNPLVNERNEICGLVEITENITEIKHLEKSLQHSRRFETVGRLASGIAHDFNNILQVINGHSEMLLETYKNDQKLTKSLDVILTSGQKASALTRQLLLFSRRQQNEFKQVHFETLLNNMQKLLGRMLGEDIKMKFECCDKDHAIDGDESQIEQIVMNLAINARDAMPNGGEININIDTCEVDAEQVALSLETRAGLSVPQPFNKPGKYLCFMFSDTGCGIPKNVVDHIFEPFFTTKESGRGTGLGLATVYSIIKQHQGFITVDSTINEGTVFKIYFPLSEAQKQAESIHTESAPVPCGKESVLIIEDDELVRDLASQVLSNFGYKVQCASNLNQAHSLVKSNRFDLFLIDIVLPDGNGVDFIEKIKDDNTHAAFILSSGYTEDKPQIKHTIHMGYSFLHKPYTINSLLNACRDALKNKGICSQ